MQKVGLIPNLEKENALAAAKDLYGFLLVQGCTPLLSGEAAQAMGEGQGMALSDLYQAADFVIALGGDGTMLGVGREAAPYGTPVMGINFGHLGFLTDVAQEEAKTAIERVLRGDYFLESRMLLMAKVGDIEELALNDVCITRGVFSKIVSLRVSLNGAPMDSFLGDGIIVCTPTGSTAYNLSAGGPILKPDGNMVAITPICPHTLYARSTVVSDKDVVQITVDGGCLMSVDGKRAEHLAKGQVVEVRRAPYDTKIMKTKEHGFYDILRSKLMQNGGVKA